MRRPRLVRFAPLICAVTHLVACSGATVPAAPSALAPPATPAALSPAALSPAALSPAALSPADTELAAALDARIAAEGDAFSGVVLVARGGTPIYQKAVGRADREHGRDNTLGTRFDLASLGKMFTAVAVLQLVQAGEVQLDAPLGTYLKNYLNREVATRVTIHQLLTHTGGTGDIFGPNFAANRRWLRSLEDYVMLYGARGPLFEPGSRWQYSNYGFVLLGRVIEQVSGQSYYDYVTEHVFLPAGMTHTDFAPNAAATDAAEDRAIGYTYRTGGGPDQPPSAELHPNTKIVPYRPSSAGGAYSTAGDLLAFANALEGHRLLDAKHTELLTTGKVSKPDGGQYAYGFSDATHDGVRCIGHSGGGPGMSTQLRICRAPGEASSQVVAVLTNLDPPAGASLMRSIRQGFAAAPTAASAPRPCRDLPLDDFEDGDISVSPSGLGNSLWHSYHDLSGSTLQPEGDLSATRSDDSEYAAHVSGTLAATRFTWAGVALQPSDMTAPYDLSPWSAVCFRARGSGTMRFDVSDVNTAPEGGVCRRCYDVFGANITLSEGWTEPSSTYDLWVDDVRLMCRSAPAANSTR